MKNNYTKKLFEMNKFFIISFFIVVSFFLAKDVGAISGACSSHNGVNCSMGRQLNGKVYCNDGWTDSMADYDFMVACKNYDYSCTLIERENISQKYGLGSDKIDGLFNQMQDITNKMSDIAKDAADLSKPYDANLFYSLQIQYNALKNQYDTGMKLIDSECRALGADRASQENYERMQSDFYNTQIKNEQDKLAQLEQEKQKLTENYLNELNKLNTPQYTCPANSILSGTICSCNDGYVSNGSACITYTQNCQAKYGINSYGNKNSCTCTSGYVIYNNQCILDTEYCRLNYGNHTLVKIINGTAHCDCETGYVWNLNITACIKIEAKPIIPLPTAKIAVPPLTEKPAVQEISNSKKEIPKIAKSEEKEAKTKPIIVSPTTRPVIQETSDSKDVAQKITKLAEKLIIKSESAQENTLTTSTSEKISVPREEIKNDAKQGFFVRIFGSVKNFFSKIFR